MTVGDGLFSIGLFYLLAVALQLAASLWAAKAHKKTLDAERLERIEKTLEANGLYL